MTRRVFFYVAALLFSFISLSAQASEPMKIAYYDNYAPRSYLENGEMKGVIVDIINEVIVGKMGINVSHKGYPWKRAQLMVEKGTADAFITVPTKRRREYTYVSKEPLFKFETYIATTKDNPKINELKNIKNINELHPYRIVDYYGNGWSKNALKNQNVYWLPDYVSIFKFMLQGKADVLIVSRKTIHSLESTKYNDKFVVFSNPLTSVGFHLCIGKKSKYYNILDKFDETLKTLKEDGTIERIMKKYY